MLNFVAIRALAGYNYIRADEVIAVREADGGKCTVYMTGGVTIPCSEAAKDVIEKIQASEREATAPNLKKESSSYGDGKG